MMAAVEVRTVPPSFLSLGNGGISKEKEKEKVERRYDLDVCWKSNVQAYMSSSHQSKYYDEMTDSGSCKK